MKRGEKKRKKKEQGEIVATFKDNEKSFNGVTGRLRHVIAARCNCERAVQRLNPLPLFAPVLVSIAGRHQEQCLTLPFASSITPTRWSASCEGRKNSFASPRYPRPSLIVGSRVKESWRHCIVRPPPTSITVHVSFARGKENFKFQRPSELPAWLMAGKVRGKFHHRIQIVPENLSEANGDEPSFSNEKKKNEKRKRRKKGTFDSFFQRGTRNNRSIESQEMKTFTFENSRRDETKRNAVCFHAYRCKKTKKSERERKEKKERGKGGKRRRRELA